MRIPRPPPPSTALIITGSPISAATRLAASSSGTAPSLPGMIGRPAAAHFGAGAILFSHHADHLGRGPDEGDVRCFADLGEIRVLGKEAIAGMNRVYVGDFRGTDHLRDVQVAIAAAGRANADGFVGEPDMKRVAVGFGIDRYGADVELLAGGKDAQGDLTTVGDQDFSEHGSGLLAVRAAMRYLLPLARMPKSGSPYSTGLPLSA